MTATLHDPVPSGAEPPELLRVMLEEQFAAQTARLTRLTVRSRLLRPAGHDARTLALHIAATRERIAETAQALRRMTEGTYGVCAVCRRPIPLGRLRAVPHATVCSRC